MRIFVCDTHKVRVIEDENRREFTLPPGSIYRIPQCYLLKAKFLQEGRFGDCFIREEKQGVTGR